MFWQRERTAVIKADELRVAIIENRAPVLVDVRSESDFQQGHLPGAINIPLDELERRRTELDETKPTVFY